jgi:hypothetical protein
MTCSIKVVIILGHVQHKDAYR